MFAKVFMWMFIGLMVTAISSYYCASNPNIMANVFGTNTYLILLVIEIGLVIFLSTRIRKMSFMTAAISFILYSLITGITCASILVIYPINNLIFILGLTSILFLIFGTIGFCTNLDLGKISNVLFVMLIGVIVTSLINIFIGNGLFEIVISIICVVVFLGLTAYDIQRIKLMSQAVENENQMAIYGALQIYLDFINIFLRLLSIFGKE